MPATKLTKKQRTEAVDEIIANGCGCYTEEERPVLMNFSDERLSEIQDHFEEHTTNSEIVHNAGKGLNFGKVAARRLKNSLSDEELQNELDTRKAKAAAKNGDNPFAKKGAAEDEAEDEEDEEDEADGEEVMMKKGTKNAKTREQWLAEAPAEDREVLIRTFNRDKKLRDEYLETIVNHYVPDGDEEQTKEIRDAHNAMSFDHLEKIAGRIKREQQGVQNDRSEDREESRPASYEGRIAAFNRKQEKKGDPKPLGLPSVDDMFAVINGRKTKSYQGDEN